MITEGLQMRSAFIAILLTVSASAAMAEPSDRAAARTDDTRAKAEGRFNRLESQQGVTRETVVREEAVTVPVKRAASKRTASPAAAALTAETARTAATRPATK